MSRSSMKTLGCRCCGESVDVDRDCGQVVCGRCLMGAANRYARLEAEGELPALRARHAAKRDESGLRLRRVEYRNAPDKCRHLVRELGSVTAAAKAMKVARATLNRWLAADTPRQSMDLPHPV